MSRPQASRLRRDGGASSLEFVLIFPVIMAAVIGALQMGMYYYAREVTTAAAQSGLDAARGLNGTAAAGITAANSFLDRAGRTALPDANVSGARSTTTAVITVTASAPRVIPFFNLPPITSSASGPVERVTQP